MSETTTTRAVESCVWQAACRRLTNAFLCGYRRLPPSFKADRALCDAVFAGRVVVLPAARPSTLLG